MPSARLLKFTARTVPQPATVPDPDGAPQALIVVSTDGFRELVIPAALAAELMAGGLVCRCAEHGLHLNPSRLWTTDDVERLLVAAAPARTGGAA